MEPKPLVKGRHAFESGKCRNDSIATTGFGHPVADVYGEVDEMEGISLPIREIVGITEELARYWRDHSLMDQLTVTRGYAELVQLDPSNLTYCAKLQIALKGLSEIASQRGLRSVTERIREMGIDTASNTGYPHASSSPA